MSGVVTNHIAKIAALSTSPQAELQEFTVIVPTYDMKADKNGVIAGIVCCLFSVMIAKDDIRPSVPLFALGAYIIYHSQGIHKEEKPEYKNQIEEQTNRIEGLFKDCKEVLITATHNKRDAIKTAVNDHIARSMEEVKQSVMLVADIYDYKKNGSLWDGTVIPLNPISETEYKLLLESAAKLIKHSETEVSQHPLVQKKFKSLKTTATHFIEGIKPSETTVNFYYVAYGWNPTSSKAMV